MPNELTRLTARDAVELLRSGGVSPLELIDAAAERIEAIDPAINALPITCFDRARAHAAEIERNPPADPPPWYLYGLPIAVKDLNDVAGVPTTHGSTLLADNVPTESDAMVRHLEEAGAVVIAKSNTPEFGAGSHTFNELFGVTANPWDVGRSAGGSSGGSTAALAAGEVWLATGSDLGGSCRNPASFCGVVGVRPSPGRVPKRGIPVPAPDLGVLGPLARTVGDAALMLDAMSGPDDSDPRGLARPPVRFSVTEPRLPIRVGYTPDLGGITPVDPEVATLTRQAAEWFAGQGVVVEEASIDLTGARETFHILRAANFAAELGDSVHRTEMKDDVIWNVETGLALTPGEIEAAQQRRGEIYRRTLAFFDDHDLLLCPAAAVPPFPKEWLWPTEIDGVRMPTYIDWLVICSAISLTTCPALSVPAGLTSNGLPVGLQIVGPPHREDLILGGALAFESDHPHVRAVPRDPT